MAINFLTSINLNGNQLIGAPVQNLATAPGVATFAEGQMYFNTTNNNLYVLANGAFVDLTSQGDITAIATGSPDQLTLANAAGPVPTLSITTGGVADGSTDLVTSGTIFAAIAASADGTVTSVQASVGGDALAVSGGPITSSGTLAFAYQGNDTQFIDGAGALTDIVTIQGVASITGTAPISIGGSATIPNISMAAATASANGYLTSTNWTTFNNKVTSVATGAAATITIGGTAKAPTVAANTAAVADSGTNLATGDQIHTFVTDFGYTTNVGTVTSVSAGDGIRVTGTASVTPTVAVQTSGTSNYVEVANLVTTADSGDKLALSDTSDSVNKITLANVPMAALSAVKTYVDNAVAGSTSFQGGYNASTNVPNLDATPTITIEKGMQWVVTADGSFFTEQVRIGDLLIANSDAPTALADWTTVQGNVDLATTTVAGIASFSSSNFAVSAAGAVTIKNNGVILGTETTGNYVATLATSTGLDNTTGTGEGSAPTVSLDFNELSEDLGDMFITLTDGEPTPKKSTPAQAASLLNGQSTYAATITANATVTHNLGTKDVIVQLYDVTTFETVYADIDRTTTNAFTVSFGATPTNSIRVLVQKIG